MLGALKISPSLSTALRESSSEGGPVDVFVQIALLEAATGIYVLSWATGSDAKPSNTSAAWIALRAAAADSDWKTPSDLRHDVSNHREL